jgi:Protein of unknown function (DUF4231)
MEELVLGRLDEQLDWYERRSKAAKQAYQGVKLAQIVIAAAIPIVVAANGAAVIAAVLGGAVVVLEGAQQLFQFQQNWIRYRGTAEALRHEKFLYQAQAGAYAGSDAPTRRLAEAVEALVSTETASWSTLQTDNATARH